MEVQDSPLRDRRMPSVHNTKQPFVLRALVYKFQEASCPPDIYFRLCVDSSA